MSRISLSWSLVHVIALVAEGRCPFASMGTPPAGHAPVPDMASYSEHLDELDVSALVADIDALLTNSSSCWPADDGNYGPFFIRLAWHCSGTYRQTDGRGGCSGGRQRFEPEASWEDNANLDKARALLAPIKNKYGDKLSWGDLFVTAGTAAIKSMGGPVKEMCFGRIDDPDGTSSLDLGPNEQQQKVAPCAVNGKCEEPLGSTTLGLIYVNPEGPVVKVEGEDDVWVPNPDPTASVRDVRSAFSRMGMNDTETVALIGGGHAFGRTHLYTSGFDGPWTTTPYKWSNEFFFVLLTNDWEKYTSRRGHWQWRTKNRVGPSANVMRLTTDLALLKDVKYLQIVAEFVADAGKLDNAFAHAWLKLTTSGGRWAANKRCITNIPSGRRLSLV